MKTLIPILTFFFFCPNAIIAQVGIGNTNPQATVDISATSLTTPTNEDGILIPRIDEFPATNPTAAQDGMLVFVTGNGAPTEGFYYWDQGTTNWVSLNGLKNTLDAAYDEGGAGVGRYITADNGAVEINGTDGFLVTGTAASGSTISISGAGTRMFFNPRKAAFRVGYVDSTQWDDANVGSFSIGLGASTLASGALSTAFGDSSIASGIISTALGKDTEASGYVSMAMGEITTASGTNSTTLGYGTTASGNTSTAMGRGTDASGQYAIAMGQNTLASGSTSTATGNNTTASGIYSTATGNNSVASGSSAFSMGRNTVASGTYSVASGNSSTASGSGSVAMGDNIEAFSAYETIFGRYSTNYTPSSTTSWNTSDRLFTIGNGTSNVARSNALTIYKDGTMNINDAYNMPTTDGTAGQVMTTDGAGNVSFSTVSSTDNQTIDNFSFNTTTNELTLEIENDGITPQTVDLSSLSGEWSDFGSFIVPRDGTNEDVAIGTTSVGTARLNVRSNKSHAISVYQDYTGTAYSYGIRNFMGTSATGTGGKAAIQNYITTDATGTQTGVYNYLDNDSPSEKIGTENTLTGTSNANMTGTSNSIITNGSGTHYGVYNNLYGPGSGARYSVYNRINGTGTGERFGVYNLVLGSSGNNTQYGVKTYVTNTGSGDKYGSHIEIENYAGGTHYGVYAEVPNTSGYAAYLLGRTSLGTTSANRYLMPSSDGTSGQVMTTDGAGNVSFSNVPSDADWYEEGTSSAPNSNTDNIFTMGNVGIGDTTPDTSLDVENNADLISASISNTTSTGNLVALTNTINSETTGYSWVIENFLQGNGTNNSGGAAIYNHLEKTNASSQIHGVFNYFSGAETSSYMQGTRNQFSSSNAARTSGTANTFQGSGSLVYGTYNFIGENYGTAYGVYNITAPSDDISGNLYGLYNDVNGTGDGVRYGVYSDFNESGSGTKYGMYTEFSSIVTSPQYGMYNSFEGTNGSYYGMQNDFGGASVNPAYGMQNILDGTGTGSKFGTHNFFDGANGHGNPYLGLDNDFEDTGNGDRYGVRNTLEGTGSGIHYGMYNLLSGSGNGLKFGTYNIISNAAGGTHYGTYNQVSTTNGWAGYFVGKNYISQNLGINNPNPDGRIDIIHNSTGYTSPHLMLTAQSANTGTRITFDNAVETDNYWVVYTRADDTDSESRFNIFHPGAGNIVQIRGDGQVGINDTDPVYALELPNNTDPTIGRGRANAWTTYSDSRVKKNQQELGYGLSEILRITPKSYLQFASEFENGSLVLKEGTGTKEIGFIAQELMNIIPEATYQPENEDQELWSVDYEKIIPVAVNAIKELNTKVKTLHEQLESMDKENQLLKQQLKAQSNLTERVALLESLMLKMNEQDSSLQAEK